MHLSGSAALHTPLLDSMVGGGGVGELLSFNMTSKTQAKTPKNRHIVDSDSGLYLENEPLTTLTDDWPRFIILTSINPERPIGKVSPFAIHKGILGITRVYIYGPIGPILSYNIS